MRNKKGFTLIEMLAVIAIIAVLVSIVIPIAGNATTKSDGAVHAYNLRSVMGQLNGLLANTNKMSAAEAQSLETSDSKMFPGAKMLIVYQNPGLKVRELLGSDRFQYAQNAVLEEETSPQFAQFEI